MVTEVDYCFRIYGDNILECELFIDWLKTKFSKFEHHSEKGAVDRPIICFKDSTTGKLFAFQICAFYGGIKNIIWKLNPLKGISNEKPDVLIVKVLPDGKESKPILIAEFDDALQAGNQSWQRARRSVDAAKHGIPYFYILPIIGWERSSDGTKLKNPRYQNAGITMGQLSLSAYYKTPSLQIYKSSPWSKLALDTKKTIPKNFNDFKSFECAIEYASYLIRKSAYDEYSLKKPYSSLHQIFEEMLLVAKTYCKFSETNFSIHSSKNTLQNQYSSKVADFLSNSLLENKPIPDDYRLDNLSSLDFYKTGSLFYKDAQKKTTTKRFRDDVLKKINWKSSESKNYKIDWLKSWGIKIISSTCEPNLIAIQNLDKIPVTYKAKKSEAVLISNRKILREIIKKSYPSLSQKIYDWIYSSQTNTQPIFFIPFYGYKPSGDSRPDRGLIPYLYSMFPKILTKKNTMVLVYSKYTPLNWATVLNDNSNQLWTAIKEFAGLVIVDKTSTGELL